MRNLKILDNNISLIEEKNGYSKTPVQEAGNKKDHLLYIGLNFNSGATPLPEQNKRKQKYKAPVLIIKIDLGKLIVGGNKKISPNDIVLKEASVIENQPDPAEKQIIDENKSINNIAQYKTLSFREKQIFRLIALGKSRREIADQLFLSFSTINTYRARILEKMELKNNAEIMRYAFKNNLVE